MHSVKGNIVDLHRGRVFSGEIYLESERIVRIEPREETLDRFVIPGFVDAHIHIESSLLAPAEFARAASVHGTVATVSDPHEIANVLGLEGVDYMIRESRRAGLKIFYGAPSCVPATTFESAGAVLDAAAVAELLARPEILFLSEVMNFPGVLNGDPDLLAKIAAAKKLGKPVDGHAPQLRNPRAAAYAAAGISTDHECTSLAEALEAVASGEATTVEAASDASIVEAGDEIVDDLDADIDADLDAVPDPEAA